MKKHLLQFLFLGFILGWANIASATNPSELLCKVAPPPPDSIQVTIDLGIDNCASLKCAYFTVFVTGTGGPQFLIVNKLYSGWATYTLPWIAITVSNPQQICVYWHSTGNCNPLLSDKTCCWAYSGSGTYSITCNPCE